MFFIVVAFIACKNNTVTGNKVTPATIDNINEPVPPVSKDYSGQPDTMQTINKIDSVLYKTGYALVNGSDCAACHKTDVRAIGPSYSEIANKYKLTTAITDTLVNRIINGSGNVWGSFPMPAHLSISKEDAKKMIAYIFSYKK